MIATILLFGIWSEVIQMLNDIDVRKFILQNGQTFRLRPTNKTLHQKQKDFSWSLGYFRKLAFWSPWGNYFTPGFCAANIRRPGITCTDTALSGYQFIPWSSGASDIHLLCPEKFTLGQCRFRTTELSICRRTGYHWTNAPRTK